MRNWKETITSLFKKPAKQQKITIAFITIGGKVNSFWKADKDIPVRYAASAIDRIKADISAGMAKKVYEAGYKKDDPNRRRFISKQTLGDIL